MSALGTQSICLMNINSIAGGCDVWANSSQLGLYADAAQCFAAHAQPDRTTSAPTRPHIHRPEEPPQKDDASRFAPHRFSGLSQRWLASSRAWLSSKPAPAPPPQPCQLMRTAASLPPTRPNRDRAAGSWTRRRWRTAPERALRHPRGRRRSVRACTSPLRGVRCVSARRDRKARLLVRGV